MIRRTIEVTTQFEGIHSWPDAPDEVEFLRNPHRHMFHVKLALDVVGDDRELEFILVKRWLEKEVFKLYGSRANYSLAYQSCEMMAERLLEGAHEKYGDRGMTCWVTEDGENGARVEYVQNR